MKIVSTVIAFVAMLPFSLLADEEKGKISFKPIEDQSLVHENYRLEKFEFDFSLKHKRELKVSGFDIHDLKFQSPYKSPHEVNNTVYAEYYVPKGKGPFPGVIILDIMGGDEVVSKGLSNIFAQNGIAALFVQMPYYGQRRPKDSKQRLISPDIATTMKGIQQTVLDNRCAAAWLESRPEIDAKRIGIHGTSLGSFMAALTSAAEPRINRVSLLLGGGGLVDAYWDHPQAKPYLRALALLGGDRDSLKKAIAPADPITFADRLKKRDLLMISASRDDVVPPVASKSLWEATGKQKIVWFNSTHVGAAVYLFDATEHIIKHFKSE